MTGPTVLVIDDDPDFAEVTKVILETKQYNVKIAYNPEEGFARLEEEPPDAIILDVMMGKGDEGLVLARKIRKDHRFDKIPILMLTSMQHRKASPMGEQAGFDFSGERTDSEFLPVDEYIEKGVDPQVFLEKVERQLAAKGGG